MKKQQQSSIDQLPADIKEKLQELLRDPRVTQLSAVKQINEILARDGHDERVSKSAVNRYAMKMREVGEKIQQSREIAKMWIARLGAEPQGDVGKLLNEMVRNIAFDRVMAFAEGDELAEPKMLKDLAIAVERLERAASENVKRDEEIRKKALAEAADIVEESAEAQGMDKDQVRFWREKFLGMR